MLIQSNGVRTTASAASRLALVACLVGWALPSAAQSQEQTITLGVGQQRVLQIEGGGIQRVAVGDTEVADVKTIGTSEVLILGVAEGRTTLLIWRQGDRRVSYMISVRKQDPKEIVSEIRALLGDIEGVSLRIVGDRVYLDGETLTTEDADRVQRVTTLYPQVRSFVRSSVSAVRALAKNLVRAFNDNGLKSIVVNVVGNTIFLEGTVESPEDLKKAELVVKAMGAQVENLITVGIKRMVLVEVQIVEIRRSDDWGLGITYPTNFSSQNATVGLEYVNTDPPNQGQPPSQLTFRAQGTLATDMAIRMRFDSGYGRLLSQPKLVCASGETAEFHVGGEVPIPLVSQNALSVEFKEFGVLLNLTPNADRQGNIQTTIETEVSDVDRSLTVRAGGIELPGFRKRKVKTNVTVKHGETIVLSGLFNYDQQKNVSKVPLLGHIPVIGELFKSREFVERKNEIAIFVTPKIVNPDSDRIRETIDKIKERYKDAADAVGFNIFD